MKCKGFELSIIQDDNNKYIDLNTVAKAKGLKSTRALRIAIQKGKYIAREITVTGGKSYEILYSSLEPEIQEKLEDESIRCTALVPYDEKKNTELFNAQILSQKV